MHIDKVKKKCDTDWRHGLSGGWLTSKQETQSSILSSAKKEKRIGMINASKGGEQLWQWNQKCMVEVKDVLTEDVLAL
jgi:hypothetical protein